jgi:succinate dehydrogenase / fumarate reductase flavoprotein subunit
MMAGYGFPLEKEICDKNPNDIEEELRDYFLERKYPSFGNLAPRDISSRSAKEACDDGRGVGPGGRGVYLDFGDAISRLGESTIRERYGNLFQMYERITGENAYNRPMRNLSGNSLYHGRFVGGLQPDDHSSGMFCSG